MQYILLLSDMYFKHLLYHLHLFLEDKTIKLKSVINIILFVGLKIGGKDVTIYEL